MIEITTSRLPAGTGYQEVEYIQSSGTQYINTGFKPNNNSRIVVDIDITAQSSQSALFGARNATGSSGFNVWTWNNNEGYQVDYASVQYYPVGGISNGRHYIDNNKNVLSVDGTVINTATTASFTCSYEAYLFTVKSGSSLMTSYPCTAKLYSCQIYDNGTLVRDFVPSTDSSGDVGLYDLIEKKFYTNVGTGVFEKGRNISSSITITPGGIIPMQYAMRRKMMVNPLPPLGTALNDCTWKQIAAISRAGLGSTYFSVGARKTITVSGTIGTLAVNDSYDVYIIGFDHNGATNTIDFGTFKTTSGKDVSLIDSKYSSYATDGTKYFNMNHWGNYNYGAWKGCDLRYDILGSTDIAPSGYGAATASGRIGYDASTTCATNPIPNTLMAALPADLRAVMKPMIVYTDSVGNSSNVEANVSASIDYLPLLAEYEIFGKRTYANTYEQNYQKQYAYYSEGNSKVKYRHSAISSTSIWKTRSARYNSNSYYGAVNTAGSATYGYARLSQGLAPIFRV